MRRKSAVFEAVQLLVFVGGTIILLIGILALLNMPLSFTFMSGHMMLYPVYNMGAYIGAIGVTSGVVILLSAIFVEMRTGEAQYWYVLALIFGVFGLVGGGGLLVGSILTAFGSILGIGYRLNVEQGAPSARTLVVQRTHYAAAARPQAKPVVRLTPEERKLYEITRSSDGAIFQAELVEQSGFSKVKVSRILDRLEGRGFIERRRRGMTNIVIIKNGDAAQAP